MKNEILGIVHVKVGVKAGAGGREGVEALLVIGVTLCHLQAGLSPTKEPRLTTSPTFPIVSITKYFEIRVVQVNDHL